MTPKSVKATVRATLFAAVFAAIVGAPLLTPSWGAQQAASTSDAGAKAALEKRPHVLERLAESSAVAHQGTRPRLCARSPRGRCRSRITG